MNREQALGFATAELIVSVEQAGKYSEEALALAVQWAQIVLALKAVSG